VYEDTFLTKRKKREYKLVCSLGSKILGKCLKFDIDDRSSSKTIGHK
jgi:hypothetical protein